MMIFTYILVKIFNISKFFKTHLSQNITTTYLKWNINNFQTTRTIVLFPRDEQIERIDRLSKGEPKRNPSTKIPLSITPRTSPSRGKFDKLDKLKNKHSNTPFANLGIDWAHSFDVGCESFEVLVISNIDRVLVGGWTHSWNSIKRALFDNRTRINVVYCG